MKYPTPWRVVWAFSRYCYSENSKPIIRATGDKIVVQWQREIAPYHIEQKYTEHELSFETGKIHNPNY